MECITIDPDVSVVKCVCVCVCDKLGANPAGLCGEVALAVSKALEGCEEKVL